MSRNQPRRKVVLDALLKLKESGLLEVISKAWIGDSPKGSQALRENPNFMPAGLVQTKSVFVALIIGQVLAIATGLFECFAGRGNMKERKPNIEEENSMPVEGCPSCGCQCRMKKEKKEYANSPRSSMVINTKVVHPSKMNQLLKEVS